MTSSLKILLTLVTLALLGFLGWTYFKTPDVDDFTDQEPEVFELPLGLPPVPWPEDNPYSKKKADLGQLLYFDTRLSSDGTISCASCHAVPKAFTDHREIAIGIRDSNGTRHSPTVINAGYQKLLFWDGRAKSLEDQAKGPLGNPKEMATADDVHRAHLECEKKVYKIKGYRDLFKEVFGTDQCSMDHIAKAIATFERTVVSGNAPFDRYMAGDKTAMTQEQIHGWMVYKHSGCLFCHSGHSFSDGAFFNIGVGMDEAHPDLGRYDVTHKDQDKGAFKTPTLREVTKSYPYMHNGSIKSLEAVIEYYDKGGIPNPNLHPRMKPLGLTKMEKDHLLSFLKALEGEGWQHFKAPEKFPE